MTDPFARAIDAGFAHLGVAASYTPAGGAAVAVTTILDRPDREIDVGLSGLQLPSWRAQLRTAELPAGAAKDDAFAVGPDLFRVRRISHDALRLVATLDLDPA